MESLTDKKIKQDHLYLPICLNCVIIPRIKLLNEKYLNIYCNFCKISSTIEIYQYIKMIKTGELYHHFCEAHEEIRGDYYCIKCDNWLCIECKKSHIHNSDHPMHVYHRCTTCLSEVYKWDCPICGEYYCDSCKELKCTKTHKIEKVILYPLFTQLYRKFSYELIKAENYLNEYYLKLKKKFNSKEVEEAYNKGKKMNSQILEIIRIIVESFKLNNGINGWAKMVNELNISFKLLKCQEEENESEVIRFLKTNLIFQPLQGIQIFTVNKDKLYTHKRLSHHCSEVVHITLLKDGRLASCSFDWSVRIFDIAKDFHCDITIKEQEKSFVYLVSLDNNRLSACTRAGYIYIWKITKSSYQQEVIISAHEKWINCLISIPNNYIVSCSNDGSFKIWNSNSPYKCITGKKGKEQMISLIKLKRNNCLVSCSKIATIIFWDISVIESIIIVKSIMLNNRCTSSHCLFEDGENRLLVGVIAKVVVIDIQKYEKIFTIDENGFGYISGFCDFNDKVIIGNELGDIYILEVKEKKYNKLQNEENFNYIKSITNINDELFALSS